MSNPPTTASILGQFRRDLEAEGFNPNEVADFVRDAARLRLQQGAEITVSPAPECRCFKCHSGAR